MKNQKTPAEMSIKELLTALGWETNPFSTSPLLKQRYLLSEYLKNKLEAK